MLAQASPSHRGHAGTGRPARPAAALSLGARVRRVFAGAVAGAVRSWRIRRAAVALERLDDRTLADIGLDRTRVRSAAQSLVEAPGVDPRNPRRDA